MEFSKEEIIAVILCLVTVIGLLYKLLIAWHKSEQERFKKCDELNKDSNEKIVELTGKYKYLEGRVEGVENLSKSVLKAINEVNNGQDKYSSKDS